MATKTGAWFEVDTKGMRELHSGRESWQVIKELVSNAFDEESASECIVLLEPITDRTARLTVSDNGKGFARIEDAWTLMASTPKRTSATVRGRFNIGEKELLCTAKEARIYTSGYCIRFDDEGRHVNKSSQAKGTTIDAVLYLGNRQVEKAILGLERINPPANFLYKVNGTIIQTKTPYKVTTAKLKTVIWKDGVETSLTRETAVEIYKGEHWLYEMGIPVQEIECPYGVNILQKIPMPPNRDVVKDTYLQDVYTTVLNVMADEIENPSMTWIRTAIEDPNITPEATKEIILKRYGDKVVLWSNDPKANDEARQHGFEVVHGRTLSENERAAFLNPVVGGVQYSAEAFPTKIGNVAVLPLTNWTAPMKRTAEFTRYYHKLLLGYDIKVQFIASMESRSQASYGNGYVTFNKVHLGDAWFEKVTPDMVGLLIHEFAHNQHDTDGDHDSIWMAEVVRLAGLTAYLAADDLTFRIFLHNKEDK